MKYVCDTCPAQCRDQQKRFVHNWNKNDGKFSVCSLNKERRNT